MDEQDIQDVIRLLILFVLLIHVNDMKISLCPVAQNVPAPVADSYKGGS